MALTTKISELPAKGATLGTADLVPIAEVDAGSPTGYTTKYVTGAEIPGGGGGGNTIYTADDTVTGARTVSIGSSLAFAGGQMSRTNANGRNIVEVIRASDLPTTLVANTTYIIRGSITFSVAITVSVEGCEIIGLDRNEDEMVWSGTGSFIRVTDVNFGMSNLKFSSTQENTILRATNYTAGNYNEGRNKVLRLSNIQFRGTYSVMQIVGFDLVDINNCLFFYVKATVLGCEFEGVSKLQITSCEFIRWFDESTLPTPSGFSTVSMIYLKSGSGNFGAVNINGCIIHPQDVQNGIEVDTLSTTGFGTISSNAFINTNLNGEVFLPVTLGLPDYSTQATLKYDVFANQGILNSTSGCVMTFIGNTNDTDLLQNVPAPIETDGLAVAQAAVRFSVSTAGRCTYIASKRVYCSIHGTLSYDKQQNGTDTFNFYLYKNGVVLPGSQVTIEATQNSTNIGTISLNYGTLMTNNDYIEVYVENITSGDDIIISDLQLVIRE